MEPYYLEIRAVHIGSVLASGALFFLRGVGVNLFQARWPMAWPARWLSYSIDTVLLTAALMLTTIVRQFPFVHGWLTVKVVLLVAYIVLGSFALKRGRTRRQRTLYWLAATAVFLFIVSVARAHDPPGLLGGVD